MATGTEAPSLAVITAIADKLFVNQGDFFSFLWNEACFWFNKLWLSVPHHCVILDPTIFSHCMTFSWMSTAEI